jgi:hypothetical protein
MSRTWLFVATVSLFVPPAFGATAEPASVRLPVPLETLAGALGIAAADPSVLLLQAVRQIFYGPDAQTRSVRDAVAAALRDSVNPGPTMVPLPMGATAWQQRILETPTSPDGIVTAILTDRRAALLYYGLSAMDEDTLAWLAVDPDALPHLKRHAGVVAAFGRSIRIRAGRISVPGGSESEPLWKAVVGADPGAPAAFVQRVITEDGRLAFFYDTLAHLDSSRQRFALGLGARVDSQEARLRALLGSFAAAAPEWRIEERPFTRPPIDGAILLSTVRVTRRGTGAAPIGLRIWDRVFRGDDLSTVKFEPVSDADTRGVSEYLSVDAAWLASHVLRVPYAIGKRRMDTFLFGQRVFGDRPPSEAAAVATALRGYLSYPALMIAIEQAGIRNPATFANAARHAARLNTIDPVAARKTAISLFQSAVALIDRASFSGALDTARAETLVASLCSLDVSTKDGYDARFRAWFRGEFLATLAARSSAEETLLTAIAGAGTSPGTLPTITWEGRSYRVDPGFAELRRLQRVRQVQGGPTLDVALSPTASPIAQTASDPDRSLAEALISIVYAVHLGDPEGPAVTSGNVALRHEFGITAVSSDSRAADPWQLPIERFDGRAAWRIRGSMLGLEAALGRLTLRRLDPTSMPAEPKLGSQDHQTVVLTAALLNAFRVTDSGRDQIAAALARGRARITALTTGPSQADDVARAAGLSEWRHQALKWSLAQGRAVLSQFSLLEVFWAGSIEGEATDRLRAWGAAALPLTGCLCLDMPQPAAWEDYGGRQMPVLATRGADVALQVADALAALQLPASLAPALSAFVTQDVLEHAQLAYQDDWQEFGRAAKEIPRERLVDYIAALTAGGPLVGENR